MGYTTSTIHGIEVPDSVRSERHPEDIGKVVTGAGGRLDRPAADDQRCDRHADRAAEPAGQSCYNTITTRADQRW